MSSEKTQYYSLHRWRPEDAFLRAEFNENSELVDSALHGIRQEAATGVSGVQAAVEEARRAAEEAVEGARSEALAAVSGAENELTEALNKAKADLNAAVAAAKKEAAAAVEEAKSEAEQAVQAARDAVPLVKLAELYATQDTDSLCLELATLERSAFVVLKIYAELYTEKKEACLLCNDFFGLGYTYVTGTSVENGKCLLPIRCGSDMDGSSLAELTVNLRGNAALASCLSMAYAGGLTTHQVTYGTLSPDVLKAGQITSLVFRGFDSREKELLPLKAGSRAWVYGLWR